MGKMRIERKKHGELESCDELCNSSSASMVVALLYACMGSHEEPTASRLLWD